MYILFFLLSSSVVYFYYFDYPLVVSLAYFISILLLGALYINQKKNRNLKFLIEDSFKEIKTFSFPDINNVIFNTGLIIVLSFVIGLIIFFVDNGFRIMLNM